MDKTLVICETRSGAERLSRAIGGRFVSEPGQLEGARLVLTWTAGLPAVLADPERYDEALQDWRIDDLPIVPRPFVRLPRRDDGVAEQLTAVRALLRRPDIGRVVDAFEPTPAGTLAFADAVGLAGAVDLPVERAWLPSLARPAIRRAFAELRPGADSRPLEDAARSRAEADWLVAVNGTRAATVRGRALGGRITLGRLLTPVLALLVQRERELGASGRQARHGLAAAFETTSGSARYLAHRLGPPLAQDAADELAERVRGTSGRVVSVETASDLRPPPRPYDLAELERHASRWLGFGAGRTLDAALECYRSAVLCHPYPAEPSPAPAPAELHEIVGHIGVASAAYRGPAELARARQELPAGLEARVLPANGPHRLSELGGDARRVYDLVARRLLAACLGPALHECTDLITETEGEEFRARARALLEPGWYAAYDELPPDEDATAQELPSLRAGEPVRCVRAEREDVVAAGREPFDDGSLLAELAGAGLGRVGEQPAVIERLLELGYATRDGHRLRATPKGAQVIDLVGGHPVADPRAAGVLERRLLGIERSAETRGMVMADVVALTRGLVEHLRELPEEQTRFPRRDLGITCPRCGNGTLIENRKGFGCSTWVSREEPGCGFVIWKTIAGRQLDEEIVRELVGRGRTRELSGFRSRAGRSFRAALVLDASADQPVTFSFATGRTRA